MAEENYEPLKDRSGRPISPGLYWVARGDGDWLIDNHSEVLAVDIDAEGFRFTSNLGYGNILSPKVALKLIPADEFLLRERVKGLERDLKFFEGHMPPERKS